MKGLPWGEDSHREDDLAALPNVFVPPAQPAVTSLPREYERRVFETFPCNTVLVFRKSRERGQQLVFALPRWRSAVERASRGWLRLTPAHTRGRELGEVSLCVGRARFFGGSTTRQSDFVRRRLFRTGRARQRNGGTHSRDRDGERAYFEGQCRYLMCFPRTCSDSAP